MITVSLDRFNRYQKKINWIIERISNLPTLNDASLDSNDREILFDALCYRLQTAIEAAMDIVAMTCKDLGMDVDDDNSNIDRLANKGLIDSNLAETLKKLNGLRNVIVHRYNSLEDEIILESIPTITSALREFVKVISTNVSPRAP